MNQVADLKRALDSEVERLDAGPGLEARVLRAAFAPQQTVAPRLAGRCLVSRAMAVVAMLLAVALAATVLLFAQSLRSSVPAARTMNVPRPFVQSWFFSSQDAALQLGESIVTGGDVVVVTHDGGRTWLQAPFSSMAMNLQWIDSEHIVAIVDDGGPTNSVWSTGDGGRTWQSTRSSVLVQPMLTSFADMRNGWSICYGGSCGMMPSNLFTMYRTSDGGASWTVTSTVVIALSAEPSRLEFTDPLHGFISTRSADATARLYATSDGGVTWRLVDLPMPSGGWSPNGPDSPICDPVACTSVPAMFGNDGVVVAFAPGGNAYTYTTRDGGQTWSAPTRVTVTMPESLPDSAIAMADIAHWWIVDSEGHLWRTQDGGTHWAETTPHLPVPYVYLTAVTPAGSVLWGTTNANLGVRSFDGGVSWSFLTFSPPG